MSYEFEAHPKIVKDRPKYRKKITQLTSTGEPQVLINDEDVK